EHDADDAADFAQHDGLHDELGHDVPLLGADGAADADLARPLGDRDEHDVHDADAGGEQGDGTHHRHADAHGQGEGIELGDHGIVGQDLEIILLPGRHFADGAQNARGFLHARVVAGLVARLHQNLKTAPPTAAVAVQPGGDGDDGKIILVATQRVALGFQHAYDGVVDAVNFQPFTDGRDG